jgi:hypothetical protein
MSISITVPKSKYVFKEGGLDDKNCPVISVKDLLSERLKLDFPNCKDVKVQKEYDSKAQYTETFSIEFHENSIKSLPAENELMGVKRDNIFGQYKAEYKVDYGESLLKKQNIYGVETFVAKNSLEKQSTKLQEYQKDDDINKLNQTFINNIKELAEYPNKCCQLI